MNGMDAQQAAHIVSALNRIADAMEAIVAEQRYLRTDMTAIAGSIAASLDRIEYRGRS